MVLNAKNLRNLKPGEAEQIKKRRLQQPIYIILDNVLDTYNIGGFFRLADAVGASCLYLCGSCATPPNHRIVKASVGTYQLVPWRYCLNASEAIFELKSLGVSIYAVEQAPQARNYLITKYIKPAAFLFGNESEGLSEDILKLVDGVVEIPMHGFNKSLNVMVAAGLVLYQALESINSKQIFPTLNGVRKALANALRSR
ncbi:MAG: TrmH family RNA methyltransferase [Patescibacteria group bacterium]|nr:TrmH family RNA methyltransferase [Patescibacteria group bacterium]